MSAAYSPPGLPLLVFTDLDGTLLDLDTYSFSAAAPALEKLRAHAIPLIPTTSKTLAELRVLRDSLSTGHPFIVENGSVICFPDGYFPDLDTADRVTGFRLQRLAPPYAEILTILAQLRREHGFRFTGFHDMTPAEIARDTGLSETQASRAAERLCSEPLRWEDTYETRRYFEQALAQQDLRLVQGNRYWHVLGNVDKGMAMQVLAAHYRQSGPSCFRTLALGDSPNDYDMLRAADIAVVIRGKDGRAMVYDSDKRTIVSDEPGPVGWNTVVLQIITELEPVAGKSVS